MLILQRAIKALAFMAVSLAVVLAVSYNDSSPATATTGAQKVTITNNSGGAVTGAIIVLSDDTKIASVTVNANPPGCGNPDIFLVPVKRVVDVDYGAGSGACWANNTALTLSVEGQGAGVITQDPLTKFANTLPENGNTSGISCADVWLGELNNATITNAKPTAIGNPPPVGGINFLAATARTRSYHNTTEDEHFIGAANAVVSVTQTINTAIPGVIAGISDGTVPLCASVDKVVATVTGVTAEPGGTAPDITATVAINATVGNPPLVGMVVYWDSSVGARRGFYVVTDTDLFTTATLRATLDLCNNVPGNGSALGALHACKPENKGFSNAPFAYSNAGTVKAGLLSSNASREPGGFACSGDLVTTPPSKACTSVYDKATGTTISIGCSPGTGPPENPANTTGVWTRLETRTVSSAGAGFTDKVASYGVTQFFTPVDPNTCANNANTLRSTTYNVVWSLDGSFRDGPDPAADGWDSDWDKDGCLDWEELQAPQPVTVANGGGGRDSYNPYDCGRTIDGVWDMTVTAEPITINKAKQIVPGSFFRCRASIELPDVNIHCYRDTPVDQINPENDPGVFGDGYSGSIWPTGTGGLPPASGGPYADIDEAHDVLTAAYNAGSDTLSLEGCLEDRDGQNDEGYVYWRTSTDISVLTGNGKLDVWTNQTEANCQAGNPSEGTEEDDLILYDNVNIQIGIQGDFTMPTEYAKHYDQDLDGVPNSRELASNADDPTNKCNRRDPSNRYDYYDVSQPRDGVIDLPNDILGVILHFAPGGYGPGDENWDRPPVMAGAGLGSTWNRGAPDGVIDLPNDILGVILQFNPAGCGLT